VLAAASMVTATLCYIVALYSFGLDGKSVCQRDYIEYWAAGKQLVRGANPYDPAAILRLQRAAGLDRNEPKISFSPPVAFFLLVPLSLVSAKTGLILWMLLLLGCFSASIWLLWLINGRPDSRFHLFGYLFAPALACLSFAQIGIFLLLGIVLFLYLHNSRPFLAGAVLLPCVMKPHLFLPCAIALLFWVASRKAYRVLAGFLAALAISCALTTYLDSHVWSQYFQMMNNGVALNIYAPTLCSTARLLFSRNVVWTEFILEAAACCWAPWYFWTRRNRWSWMDHGLLVLLIAAMCAPYGWFFDETMLFPAVLAGVYRAVDSGRSLLPIGLIAGAALIELIAGVYLTTPFYLWTTPAWLIWYLYATGRIGARSGQARSDAAIGG